MGRFQSEEELWARLEELERQEEMLGELDRYSAAVTQAGVQRAEWEAVGTQRVSPAGQVADHTDGIKIIIGGRRVAHEQSILQCQSS